MKPIKPEAKRDSKEQAEFAYDIFGIFPLVSKFIQHFLNNPKSVINYQSALASSFNSMFVSSMLQATDPTKKPVIDSKIVDKRFKNSMWDGHPYFSFWKQLYFSNVDLVEKTIKEIDDFSEKEKQKLLFFMRRFLESMSPINFPATNPDIIKETFQSGGSNLLNGLKNFAEDIDPKTGRLNMRMVDKNKFVVGDNLACTPGKIVFQNELIQIIQYKANTEMVYEIPLLMIPPWINKYYILDLRPENSLVRWLISKGFSVFVISWSEPNSKKRDFEFYDYFFEGVQPAIQFLQYEFNVKKINTLGYCIGGTLQALATSYLERAGDQSINTATFLTSMIDFSEPGDLGFFVDEDIVEKLEVIMEADGYLDGDHMSQVFNILRANDLIWHFFVNNYLKGKSPDAFDILYWNSDSTRLPKNMHSFYLREMYLNNNLVKVNALNMRGINIDIAKIKAPCCFVSAVEDHIAPWRSTFMGAKLLGGDKTFILTNGGHVAGIVNPPSTSRYSHYIGNLKDHSPEKWVEYAKNIKDSWWTSWSSWLAERSGSKIKALRIKNKLILEDAPGSYVRGEKAD